MTRERIEIISISLEVIAFFFVTTDLYGERNLQRATASLRDFAKTSSNRLAWIMREFLGGREDYPLLLPGLLYVFIITPLLIALLYWVYADPRIDQQVSSSNLLWLILISMRVIGPLCVLAYGVYSVIFTLIAWGTFGSWLLERVPFSGMLLGIGAVLFLLAKGMVWFHLVLGS
ncbi:hypothetical protein AB7008_41595 [Bradyrhizobium sp. 521_C7_N1_3]|uniref:hypothetical protein n=1 Tax=Bradyrhizobium sp. 521_C7_N1_3 TaxID=3240368 RepID=UPI003F89D8D9